MLLEDYQEIIKQGENKKKDLISRLKSVNTNYLNICKEYDTKINMMNNFDEGAINEKIKDIMYDNEYTLDDNDDSNWTKMENYYKCDNILPIEYTIDDLLINKMKMYNKLCELYTSKGYDIKKLYKSIPTSYLKIYIVYDDNNKKDFAIFCTMNSILSALKRNISYYLKDDKNNNLSKFKNLDGLCVKILGIYRGINIRSMDKLKKIKEEFTNEYIKTNDIEKKELIDKKDAKLIINLNTNECIKKLVESYDNDDNIDYDNITFKSYNNINVTTQIPFKLQCINKKFIEPHIGFKYAKIYLIYDKDYKHFYFGSTKNSMSSCLSGHKHAVSKNEKYYTKIINKLNINNFFCIIIEYIDNMDHRAIRKRVDHYIQKYDATNKNIGGMNIIDLESYGRDYFLIKYSMSKQKRK